MHSKTVLSGIRATGRLHFGSFLGAVQNFVKFQDDADTRCMYFVADFHTLTTLDDPEAMKLNLTEMVKDYLAAGLDPDKSILYAQSSIPEIAQLSMYLGMLQSFGALKNIPTYKDLVKKNPNRVTHGLFSYPVLMAADILGPQANIVPVGSDQIPNVELAQKLARKFNKRFGETFVIPEMLEEMVKVPGLDGNKMGKSDADNAISLTMEREEVHDRYRRFGVTDANRVSVSDPGNPYEDCLSVYPVHELVSPGEVQSRTIAKKCMAAEIGCAQCKGLLADRISDQLELFQERRASFEDKDEMVREILHEGGKKARQIIMPTIGLVSDKMGIVTY